MRPPEPADYQALVQALKYCVLVHDAETKEIVWANRAACELLEFTVDELKPLKAPDMSGNARQYRREIGVAWLQRAVDHGESATEWCYRSKRGDEVLTEAIAIRVDLPSRPIVMVQFRDIAEEKATQRDLFRTEGRLQAFLRNLDEGIVVLDDDRTVTFASESAAKLLDMDIAELRGSDFGEYCDAASYAELNEVVARTLTGSPPQDSRYRLAAPGGAPRWYAGTCQYIEIESDLRGHLLLFHDISDRVRAEEEHRRDTQHLNYLARYNAMGDMAMAVAHEVSQPLAAAFNFVEGARGRLDSAPGAGASVSWGLDNATRQIGRASRILKSLRQYVVRLEQSEQLIDLNTIVADCLYFIELRAAQHSVVLTLDLADEPLPVRCENVLIGQVVMNLAFNAIDEMSRWPEDRRRVELSTRRSADDHAELTVLDHGQGLSAIPGGQIFEGVFTSKENGNAIGLALSHRIITRHRGRISATENEPQGAVFSFALPFGSGA
ncbi:ATP-binding protein [Streptomyces sp. NBC_01089]|uniref:ATP-binding protein n=1 Tax=Streptomyces sp. NBC_01089 TaxID=2903747 RepID=UPI00386A0D9D|nr:PAS domain S-box protein [Streptomyces sp. NBC_01089]